MTKTGISQARLKLTDVEPFSIILKVCGNFKEVFYFYLV